MQTHELQALQNSLHYYKLDGYAIHQQIPNGKKKNHYFVTDTNNISISGLWNYDQICHFIMGYGKAFNKFTVTPEKFTEFEVIVNSSKSFDDAFQKASSIKNVPAVLSEAFRKKYDPQGNRTPRQAFEVFYNEIKSN